MKLIHDSPGSRLTIGGEPKRLPVLLVVIVTLFLLPFVSLPLTLFLAAFQGNGLIVPKPIGFGIAAFFGLVVVVAAAKARRGFQRASRIDASLSAGELRIAMTGMLSGKVREDVVPLARLRSANLKRTAVNAKSIGDLVLELRTRREGEEEARDKRNVQFEVEKLDRNDEVADLAMRLGAAAGLPFYRVVRNDRRDIEVELTKEPQPGFAQIPLGLGAADYATDVVAESARRAVAEEAIAAFDPATFKSEHRVSAWEPGTRVLLRKPFSFLMFIALPFTLLVFGGPLAFFKIQAPDLPTRIIASGFLGFFGLILGLIAIFVVTDSFPRSTEIDWSSRVIRLKMLRKTVEIPFEQLRAIELKAIHTVSKGKSTTHRYRCAINALLKGSGAGVDSTQLLVETESLIDRPDEPYRMALPLAADLAKALGVERRFIDYD